MVIAPAAVKLIPAWHDQRQELATEAAVNGEITRIDGDDLRFRGLLRQHDQRAVAHIHPLVFRPSAKLLNHSTTELMAAFAE